MQNEQLQPASEARPPSQAQAVTPCTLPDCAIATERMRYYTGRFMSARDFIDEQVYFLSRSRLRNRLLHGWGIACGLDVVHHPDLTQGSNPTSVCAQRWVIIRAGMAIDCCGRELILPRDRYYELEHLSKSASPTAASEEKRSFLLGLRYTQDLVERVPALYAEDVCDPTRVEANRFREGVKPVELDYTDALKGTCWPDPAGSVPPTFYDDCEPKSPAAPYEPCITPDCPCGDMMPLALIEYDPNNLQAGFSISMLGRRELPPSPDVLTHIVDTNWKHGAVMRVSELAAQDWELRVTFDRNLLDEQSHDYRTYTDQHPFGIGINRYTFEVTWYDREEEGAVPVILFNDRDQPAVRVDHRRVAVSRLNRDLFEGEYTIVPCILHVRLKCDFILDCHGRPVDGNHLKGLLRTGNGGPGGTFESWFRIVPDDYKERQAPTPSQGAYRSRRRQRYRRREDER